MYSFLTKEIKKTYKKETLLENYHKFLICIMPIIPHFANECLGLLKVKKTNWPKHDSSLLENEKVKVVVQINGKKRGLLELNPGLNEDSIFKIINKDETLTKYFQEADIKRKIYIKNKLVNIII